MLYANVNEAVSHERFLLFKLIILRFFSGRKLVVFHAFISCFNPISLVLKTLN